MLIAVALLTPAVSIKILKIVMAEKKN